MNSQIKDPNYQKIELSLESPGLFSEGKPRPRTRPSDGHEVFMELPSNPEKFPTNAIILETY